MEYSDYTLPSCDVKKGERPGCTDRGAGGKEGERSEIQFRVYTILVTCQKL